MTALNDAEASRHEPGFARSTFWVAIGKYGYIATNLLAGAILARLLQPSAFGVVGLATAMILFLNLIAAAGLGAVVVNFQELTRRELRTLISLAFLFGGAMGIFLFIGAPLIVSFFNAPASVDVLRVLSCTLLLLALWQIPNGMLARQMRFHVIAGIELTAAVVGAVAGVILALCGFGVWSLVVQHTVSLGLRCLLAFVFAGFPPVPGWDRQVLKKTLGFASGSIAASLVEGIPRSVDSLVVSRMWGMASLGYYSRASIMTQMSMNLVAGVAGPVLQPTLARQRMDVRVMRSGYLRVLRGISLITFPVMAVASVWADAIVMVLWGQKWTTSIPLFRLLAIVGMIQPLWSTCSVVFLALRKTRALFLANLLVGIVISGGLLIGVRHSLAGAAAGCLIASWLVYLPIMIYVVVVLLGGTCRDLLMVLWRPSVIACLLVLVSIVMRWSIPAGLSAMPTLLIVLASISPLFFALSWFLEKDAFVFVCRGVPGLAGLLRRFGFSVESGPEVAGGE